jgi:hypothetical protein
VERVLIIDGLSNRKMVEQTINAYLEHGWKIKLVTSQHQGGEFGYKADWFVVIEKEDLVVTNN